MRHLFSHIMILSGLAMSAETLLAQSLVDQVNFKSGTLGGLHLYGISVYSGYSSSAYPLNSGLATTPLPGAENLGPDANYGVQATVGWRHQGPRTHFELMYSGGYTGVVHYTDLNAFNQSLALNLSRNFSAKWTLSLSGSGQDTTLAQFLYQPSSLGVIAQLPATFDDLAAAFSIGKFTDAQMASMLTGAPMLESPARTALLGNRVLTYSLQATATYAYSSRLKFHVGGVSAGGQNQLTAQHGVQQPSYLMPHTIGMNGGLGMSYSISPRTDVGVNAEEMRQVNHYQSSYITTANAFLGRKMGQHWFLNIRGGGSLTKITQQLYGTPTTKIFIGGASLGFRTFQHTLMASYDRSSSNTYGFATGAITTVMGSWTWHRPGTRWNLFASLGQQDIRNTGYMNISGWQVSGGISNYMNTHTTLTAQYVYLSNNASYYLGGVNAFKVSSVRVSLNWNPEAALR